MTLIYYTDLSICEINIEDLKKGLPNNCILHCEKYKHKDDLIRSLYGWNLLLLALKKEFNIDLFDTEIRFNEFNKPYIKNKIFNNDVYFNISHSKNIVAVIISNVECGIDVQEIKVDINQKAFAKKIGASNYSLESLIERWTKIEAYYKQKGTGIVYNRLDQVQLIDVGTLKLCDLLKNIYYLSYAPVDENIKMIYINN